MTVRAKFRLISYETSVYQQRKPDARPGDYSPEANHLIEVRTLKFQAVCDGSAENKAFFASTPGGQITLQTISEAAWQQFTLNQEYYLDFSPAVAS